jgi:capsular polysaccharide biosynthesis protein
MSSDRFPLSVMAGAVALVLALVLGGAAYKVVGNRNPTFLATTATLLDEPQAVALSKDSGVIDKLSRLRFKYSGILRSDDIIDPVAKELGVDRGVVAGAVVSQGDTGSLLLFVGARTRDPELAVRMANALAKQLSAYVAKEQVDQKIPALLRVEMRIVAPARYSAQLTPTKRQKQVAGLGTMLATLAVVLGAADIARRRRA